MGTNFYARIIPTKKRRKEIADLILKSNDFNKITKEVLNTFGTINYEYDEQTYLGGVIHLGKRSYGWKFLWNPNHYKIEHGHLETIKKEDGREEYKWIEEPYTVFKYYDLTKKSLKKFICRKDVEIYDEYGEKQDNKEFFNMALNWTTYINADGKTVEAYDGSTYHEKDGGKHIYPLTEYGRFIKELGYKVNESNSDFFSDGLRFATCTDFS